MKKIDIAKSIIKNNGGIIKTVQLNKAGIQNSEIKKMCESGEIERVRHGYYQIAGQVEISEEKMIATFLEEGIVCMESALFYYGYSDKTPLVWTIAVSRNISRSKINIDNFAYKLYFVQHDKLSLGKTTGIFNDNEMFNKAINAYVADEKKNLSQLSKYAKEMRVYKKVTELMEVMLNG